MACTGHHASLGLDPPSWLQLLAHQPISVGDCPPPSPLFALSPFGVSGWATNCPPPSPLFALSPFLESWAGWCRDVVTETQLAGLLLAHAVAEARCLVHSSLSPHLPFTLPPLWGSPVKGVATSPPGGGGVHSSARGGVSCLGSSIFIHLSWTIFTMCSVFFENRQWHLSSFTQAYMFAPSSKTKDVQKLMLFYPSHEEFILS